MVVGQGATGDVTHDLQRTCTNKDNYEGGPFREALSGSAPWWISLGPNAHAAVLPSNTKVVGDKALIIRSYNARLGGVDTSNPSISVLCDKVELSPPAGTSTLLVGDYVDIRLELLTMPRTGAEYQRAITQSERHGSATTLNNFENMDFAERAQASAVGHLSVVAPSARIESHYPVRVCVTDGSNGELRNQVELCC